MRNGDPMRKPCKAHTRVCIHCGLPEKKCECATFEGRPCKKYAIPGGEVCRNHGGAAPQVKKAAKERLKELQDPSLQRLEDILNAATLVQVQTKEGPRHVPLMAARWSIESA